MSQPTVTHITTPQGGTFSILEGDAALAVLTYVRSSEHLAIADHTEVADAGRGRGLGVLLVEALTVWAREQDVKIVALCPFAAATYKKREDLRDVLV